MFGGLSAGNGPPRASRVTPLRGQDEDPDEVGAVKYKFLNRLRKLYNEQAEGRAR